MSVELLLTENPAHLFFAWLDSVHPSDVSDIALHAYPLYSGASVPEDELSDLGSISARFQKYIAGLRRVDAIYASLHLAALVGIVDAYLATRSTKEDWQTTREVFRAARARLTAQGAAVSFGEAFDVAEANVPAREARHLAYAAQWADLRAVELSPRSLGSWGSRQLPAR